MPTHFYVEMCVSRKFGLCVHVHVGDINGTHVYEEYMCAHNIFYSISMEN